MVRVTLQYVNSSADDQKMDFSSMGTLTQPINDSTTVSVLRFNIPNNSIPLMIWGRQSPPVDYDFRYAFTLSYGGFSFQQYVKYIDLGAINQNIFYPRNKLVYSMTQLVQMLNQALTDAVTGLKALVPLPTNTVPYIYYDPNTYFFNVVVPIAGYDSAMVNPILIKLNRPLWYMLQTIPAIYNSSTGLFTWTFLNSYENQYNTSYLRVSQTSISMSSFLSMRSLLITTSMPVESEVITTNSGTSNQSGINILQSFDYQYNSGIKDVLTPNEFTTISEPFRRVKLNGKNLYDIRCQVFVVTKEGDVYPFVIQGYGYATIVLEFL